jgi:trypsin
MTGNRRRAGDVLLPMRRAALAVLAVGALLAFVPRPADAIVGGDPADEGEWPWQVALLDDGFVLCGGSLIGLDVVVTAAHCTDGYDAVDLQVTAGSVSLHGPVRDVAAIDQHEQYDPDTTVHDIAVLHLAEPFEAGDTIQPVALPDEATAAALLGDGAPAFVTGFGSTSENGDVSPVLREASVEIVGDGECTSNYAEDGDEVFGETEVCAGIDRGHIDACYGDSGGPLVVPAAGDQSSWFLVGIVSWGAGCGRPLRPTVYTQVPAYREWLTEHGALTSATGARFDSDRLLHLPAAGATAGKAGRYPSVIDVDLDGPVTTVAVELRGLTHERASDLDIWLEAPDGTVITLLSDVGGTSAIDDLDLLVDAGGPAVGGGALPLRMRPSDEEADEQRKDGQPPASFDDLSGVDADGEWQLFVADDTAGATGVLEGWSLIVD